MNTRVRLMALVLLAGCTTTASRQISLMGQPPHEPSGDALEVVTVSTPVREPLLVRGADVAFVDLSAALRETVRASTGAGKGYAGWRVALELTDARADSRDGRLGVRLTLRSTLRKRGDNTFLAQSQQVCSASDAVEPSLGAPVVLDCLSQLARDLDSWLAHVHAFPPPR